MAGLTGAGEKIFITMASLELAPLFTSKSTLDKEYAQ